MQLINQILSNSQTNFDPLNFIGIIATVIASLYIFKSETSVSFAKERHDKLIFPLFNLLEPVLYADPDTEILKQALKIIDDNKNLADGKLLEIYYYCSKNPSTDNFITLCTYINSSYDKSCRKLGLKTRSLMYRFSRNQFKNKFSVILFVSAYVIASFALMFFGFILILFFFSMLVTLFSSTSQTNQIIMIICFSVFVIAVFKYMDKHY